MTIAAHWGWNCWDARTGEFHSAQGAGGIGCAYAAALGTAAGLAQGSGSSAEAGERQRVFAVSGEGSAMCSVAELAPARQHNLPVTWLIVDDGGCGILREYMDGPNVVVVQTVLRMRQPSHLEVRPASPPDARPGPGAVEQRLRSMAQLITGPAS